MDQEIDLRPHLIALLHRWRLLVICTIGLAVITGATSLTLALIFRTASADVLIIPSSSRVTLDPRFQTTSDNQATNPVSLRQGLVNLASSYILVEQVAKDLGDPEVTIDKLYQQVKILPDGDMIRIEAGGKRAEGPAFIQPGQADNTVSVSLGYGREKAGRVGHAAGFNAYVHAV